MYYVAESGNYCVSEMEAPEVRKANPKGKLKVALAAGALAVALVTNGSVVSASETETGTLEFYKELASEMETVRVVDSSELTNEMLTSRAEEGIIYIEMIYGVCLDEQGNGEVLNPADPDYNYISYSEIEGIEVGDVVLTYCIYAPDNNYEDDVVERWDYIIDGEGNENE